jgi:hypothetical protein
MSRDKEANVGIKMKPTSHQIRKVDQTFKKAERFKWDKSEQLGLDKKDELVGGEGGKG